MFNIVRYPSTSIGVVCIKPDKFPSVIEGVELFDILCPVSSVTGLRENPLSLLQTLVNDPAKSRALDAVLQELPVIASRKGIDNDTLIEMMQPVLKAGTFYEDDKFAERLLSISSDLVKSLGLEKISEVKKEVPTAESSLEAPTAE